MTNVTNLHPRKLGAGVMAFLLAFSSLNGWGVWGQQRREAAERAKKAQKALTEEQKVGHLLDRVTFGTRPGDLDRVKKIGWEKYLEEQLYPERIADPNLESKLMNIESIHLGISDLAKYYPQPQVIRDALKAKGMDLPPAGGGTDQGGASADDIKKRREYQQAMKEFGFKPPQAAVQELQQAKILRAVYSERQLQEVMTDFWFNHFNVYIQKGADRILTTPYERDVIRPRVFGRFEDLLRATAESPAMLFYLDNFMSAAANAPARAGKNRDEGLDKLRRDRGFERLRKGRAARAGVQAGMDRSQMPRDDAQQMMRNRPRRGLNENYAREIMELHTLGVDGGYTQKDVQEVARCFTGWTLRNPRGAAEFVFNPAMHDDGEKSVLGKTIPAGGGIKDGQRVIHMLATHPATAKFISTKLARKFVADAPPPALVDRMARTFQKTEGDIREVLRAMFKSPEFWSAESYRAKIKTPFEMTVSAVRVLGAETSGGPQFHRWIAQMGEGLFLAQPPTGYADTAEQWVNTGALLERMNFALALSGNRIAGTRVNLGQLMPELGASAPASRAPSQIVDHYLKLLLRGDVSPQTRATLDKSLGEKQMVRADGGVDLAKVAGLILGSPEFQRQ
jgi:uncharacterized protein (DUF1800 family)